MNRRTFLTATSAATATLAFNGCNESNRQAIDYSKHPTSSKDTKHININRNKKTIIKLATSWPAHFPIMGTVLKTLHKELKM